MTEEYKHVTYGKAWSMEVTPEDRAVDVLHYLTTGGLLGGRSLEGVTWELSSKGLGVIQNNRKRVLAASMRQPSKEAK